VDTGGDIIGDVAHGFTTGMRVRFTSAGVLPNPLVVGTDYYLIVISEDSYRVAVTFADAMAGIFIDLTTTGTVSSTTTPQGSGQSPLPQELAVLWQARVLAQLPQEEWFVEEAAYYRALANEKINEIIEGRIRLLVMPTMPTTTAHADSTKE
jgi:hypothetical protein